MNLLMGLAFLISLFLYPDSIAAEAVSQQACLACHGVPGLEKVREGKTVSLYVDRERSSQSVHGPLGCAACHSDISQIPHPSRLGRVNCSACHGAVSDNYSQGVHGKAYAQGFTEAPTCVSCHGDIHQIMPRALSSSPVNARNIAGTCAVCHANAELAAKFRIPVVRPVEAYLESVHARAVAAGKRGAACSDCHGSHLILPGLDPRSPIWRTNVPETCGKCHKQILATYRESVHGEALDRGVKAAPICTDCHGEHRILAHTDPTSPVFTANIPGDTCGRCHGNARLSEKYGLPPDKVPAFEESYHGLALRAGRLTVANCSSCHGVHDIRPSSDPRSHVSEANLPQTCGKCHPGIGLRFSLGPAHVLPLPASNSALYWVRVIYLWLIGVLVSVMVLHNLFDFIRKARRSEWPPRTVPSDQAERMSRLLRWQHGLVMLSFPVLVYTGFALTYPESWWAVPLLRWEAKIGLRGLLHRIAACVLIGSLIWHLKHVAISRELRQKLGGLKLGFQDLRDFTRLQRYNLGLDQHPPRFRKFSYIEKIEYWAFMWGMLVMAVTGLLLWFENVSLRYLPKLAADIATAIHFYEAVLATLAIMVWHFYWVIFDPDIYPMDASWWHGRSPAARVMERSLEEGSVQPPKDQEPDLSPKDRGSDTDEVG